MTTYGDPAKGFTDYELHPYKPDTKAGGQPCRTCGFGRAAHEANADVLLPGATDKEHVYCDTHPGLHPERTACVWPMFGGYPQTVEPPLRLDPDLFPLGGYGA